ncbi:tetratricopeptide repeat protein [bacterium]|nr:tetratricopeptide repeat protein [bacterium]
MDIYVVWPGKISRVAGACAILMMVYAGCGKSPDELYTEGKNQIQNKETFDEGVKTLKHFEKKFPKDRRAPEVMLALAMAYQGQKQFDLAVESFNRLIEKYPGSAEAFKGMFLLGYMYYDEIKDNDKTLEVLKKFITQYPDSGLAASAQVLIDNIGLPVEKWSVVQKIGTQNPSDSLKTGTLPGQNQ